MYSSYALGLKHPQNVPTISILYRYVTGRKHHENVVQIATFGNIITVKSNSEASACIFASCAATKDRLSTEDSLLRPTDQLVFSPLTLLIIDEPQEVSLSLQQAPGAPTPCVFLMMLVDVGFFEYMFL